MDCSLSGGCVFQRRHESRSCRFLDGSQYHVSSRGSVSALGILDWWNFLFPIFDAHDHWRAVVNLGKRFGDGALYESAVIIVALAVSIAFAALFVWLIERASRKGFQEDLNAAGSRT